MSKKYMLPIVLILVFIAVGYFIISSKQEVKEQNQSSTTQNINKTENSQSSQPQFLGEKGKAIDLVEGRISIITNTLGDNLAHYYNTELPSGKIIFFLLLKTKPGFTALPLTLVKFVLTPEWASAKRVIL